ncbi:MAG TPA: Nramp family divalent metal transporter [Pseudobacteroides sp.]|uniref:Nramp family divalent metal transporter n=1 Tax=Pseudobacteroides sp. TaxID=1968840 RepID=UPI002F94445D
MISKFKEVITGKSSHKPVFGAREILKYLGPGLLVTVGFIDPGNWASNIVAGSKYGYTLLWMVTLSTIMLIILQHNVAHLGIVTGDCLAESTMKNIRPAIARPILATGILAVISTALAEILGGAIALELLFGIPIRIGSIIILVVVIFLLFSNTYTKLEKLIIGFVSIIGFSFLYEISIVTVDWPSALKSWVTVSIPHGSMTIVMAVLGAVVMPHNLFLHSEIIQSRQWNKEDEAVIKKQLKFEFTDTIISMIIGWAINSTMIILAATTFFKNNTNVTELAQAQSLLKPMLGTNAAIIFGIALLFSGISSTITAGMAGGTIFAGLYKEPYDIKDSHTKIGVSLILIIATVIIFLISDPFKGLVYSQMILSIQLPITVFLQIYLTSSKRIMGRHRNSILHNIVLLTIGSVLAILNIMLFKSFI